MSELRERIGQAIHGYACGCEKAWPVTADYEAMVDAVIAVLGAVEEHVEYRVVDREGDQFGMTTAHHPAIPDEAPHTVQQRTVLTFTGSWERSPDTEEET